MDKKQIKPENLTPEEAFDKAKDYAFRLLAFCPRTRKEIKDKLSQRSYSPDTIAQVLEMMATYNYVNDREYASLWIQNCIKIKPLGRWRIKQELLAKGIHSDFIDEAIVTLLDEETEYSMARSLIDRKAKFRGDNIRKIFDYLRRRGFSKEIINRIVREVKQEEAANPYE